MNKKTNKHHRDIVTLSPEAQRILNEIKQIQLVASELEKVSANKAYLEAVQRELESNKRTNKSISKKGDNK